jgi:hypothetical protein
MVMAARIDLVSARITLGHMFDSISGQWSGVLEGVSYLHQHTPCIIHGDLKPVSMKDCLLLELTRILGQYFD